LASRLGTITFSGGPSRIVDAVSFQRQCHAGSTSRSSSVAGRVSRGRAFKWPPAAFRLHSYVTAVCLLLNTVFFLSATGGRHVTLGGTGSFFGLTSRGQQRASRARCHFTNGRIVSLAPLGERRSSHRKHFALRPSPDIRTAPLGRFCIASHTDA